MLDGLYEHTPWIAEPGAGGSVFTLARISSTPWRCWHRPREAPGGLVRAHPELAGKRHGGSKTLTAESTNEQRAGLTDCTPEEFARIQQLNSDYKRAPRLPVHPGRARPRGRGWPEAGNHRHLCAPLENPVDFELAEALRNIHRIVEIRLNDKFGFAPAGQRCLGLAGKTQQHSDPGYAEKGH